jgi:hypothetical protein
MSLPRRETRGYLPERDAQRAGLHRRKRALLRHAHSSDNRLQSFGRHVAFLPAASFLRSSVRAPSYKPRVIGFAPVTPARNRRGRDEEVSRVRFDTACSHGERDWGNKTKTLLLPHSDEAGVSIAVGRPVTEHVSCNVFRSQRK